MDVFGHYGGSRPSGSDPPRRFDRSNRPATTHREIEDRWCERIDLEQSLEKLPIHLHLMADLLGQGFTEREVADHLDVSRSQIRRWKQQIADDLNRDWGLA